MYNPVSEMFEMLRLRDRFEAAVERNLVMDFEEYVRRFGFDFGEEPVEAESRSGAFVYVGGRYAAGGVFDASDIVADSCVIGHSDIISVWGEQGMGRPRLIVSDGGDGWQWMCLEYENKVADAYEGPVEMVAQVYVNRATGEYHWCV